MSSPHSGQAIHGRILTLPYGGSRRTSSGFAMKSTPLHSISGNADVVRSLFPRAYFVLLAGLIAVCLPLAGRAQPSRYEAEGEEVLTRGPVHEAFAAVVSYNPEPGIVVRTRPPELIEELPPEERPEGDDVAWIPGYWAWDDEREDFLWISGTWRILPPGREWLAGYWRETRDGHQWISGYWADTDERETVYLPPPPATLEVGANIDPPSMDYGWSPGCWVWRGDRYVWRAGYWSEGRSDWVWVPSYYVWTPRGYIFVEGFWDYPVERRGILFAPVYYRSHSYSRRGYSYSPRIAINLTIFVDNLFLRPTYHHYYFGDYYGSRYEQSGFYASVSYQSSRRGYDPFYSYSRWSHRSDRDWDNRYQAAYRYRRDNEAARPPRTWSAQVSISASTQIGGTARIQLAAPLEQLARGPDTTIRLRAVAQDDRRQLAQRGREVQATREQRRTLEASAVTTATIGRNAPVAAEPVRVATPRSSISARRPQAEAPARPQNADRRNPSENRRAEPDRGGPPEDRPAAPRGNEPQSSREIGRPEADRRPRDADIRRDAEQTRQQANDNAVRNQQQAEERRSAAEAKARDDAQRNAREESQQKGRQDSERRNRDEDARTDAEQARQRANETAVRNQQQAEERRAAAEAKGRDEAQRNAREESQQKGRQDAERRGREVEGKAQANENARRRSEEQANAAARQNQAEAQQRANEAQQKANETAARNQQQAEERRNAAEAKAQQEAQQVRQDAERRNRDAEEKSRAAEKSRQQNEERANEAARAARDESRQKENEAIARAQQEAERANAANAKAREEQQRGKQQPPAVRPPRDEPKGKPAPKPKTPEEEEAEKREKEKRGRG